MRLDIWFRTTKSRRLAKLHKSKNWNKISVQQREVLENRTIDQLKVEKQKRLDDLEAAWTRKVERGDLHKDEDENEEEEDEDEDEEEDEDEDHKPGVEKPTSDNGSTWTV